MTVDEAKKQARTDCLMSPGVVVPVVGGATAMMLAWAGIFGTTIALAGFGGILIGLGLGISKWVIHGPELMEAALKKILRQQEKDRNNDLDKLDLLLRRDRDPRDQEYLRQLRGIYGDFRKDVANGKCRLVHIEDQIEQLFEACIKHLKGQHDVWKQIKLARKKRKGELKDRRELMLQEVESAIGQIEEAIEHFHSSLNEDSSSQISKLSEELDRKLAVAKKIEAAGRYGIEKEVPDEYRDL